MTRACIVLLCGGLLAACSEPHCGGSDVRYYDDALGHQLARRDISYNIRRDGMVCVEGRHAAEFRAAQAEVDKYFHEVAELMKDACEERAYTQWAEREKLRYDVRGRLFLLRSFNADELASNRQRISNAAPKNVRCDSK